MFSTASDLLNEDRERVINFKPPDLTCKSPIILDGHQAVLLNVRGDISKLHYKNLRKDRDALFACFAQRHRGLHLRNTTADHTKLLSWLWTMDPSNDEMTEILVEGKPIFIKAIQAALDQISVCTPEADKDMYKPEYLYSKLSPEFFKYWVKKRKMEGVVFVNHQLHIEASMHNIPYTRVATGRFFGRMVAVSNFKHLEFFQTRGNFMVFNHQTSESIFINRDSVTLAASNVAERANLYMSSALAEGMAIPQYIPATYLTELLEFGDGFIHEHGNDAYKLLCSYEPLMVGCTLMSQHEPVCDGEEFFRRTRDDSLALDFLTRENRQKIIRFLLNAQTKPAYILSQAFGLYRIWGHPYVNTQGGISKVKALAKVQKAPQLGIARQIGRLFKQKIYMGYKQETGVWPDHEILVDTGDYLQDALSSNKPIDPDHKLYDLALWDNIKTKKFIQYDSLFNLATLLSDKAISPSKSKVVEAKARGENVESSYRRLLLTWLSENYTSALEFLTEVDNNGFSDDDLIIGVSPKEREMKSDPRLFALMTIRVRLYFVLTEALLADYVLKYFPEITMTYDFAQLQNRIYEETICMKTLGTKEVTIVTNVDFQKWNQNMRDELTRPVFAELDSMFGFKNMFTKTHEIFRQSTIYLTTDIYEIKSDGKNLLDGPAVWHNHYGGFEGLRQKGWTIVTAIILEMAAKKNLTSFSIMGQGDNQVILSKITSSHGDMAQVSRRHKQFLSEMFTLLEAAGLPIKPYETWTSSNLFMYGKAMVLNGLPLPMSMKRECRIFQLANESYHSLENTISTIYSNANSACMYDHSTVVPFLMASYHAADAIYYHMTFSPLSGDSLLEKGVNANFRWQVMYGGNRAKSKPSELYKRSITNIHKMRWLLRDKPQICADLLLLPKALGGYPVQSFASFALRGFPDPLCEWGAMYKRLAEMKDSPRYRALVKNVINPELLPEPNFDQLVKDPVSINVPIPTVGSSAVRILVESFLETYPIKNIYFKAMMDFPKQYPEFPSNIVTKGAVWPRLLHDIYSSSIFGYATRCVRKITTTNTIADLSRRHTNKSIIGRLITAEQEYFNSAIYKVYSERVEARGIPKCFSSHIQGLRNKGWKRDVQGVTIPHPLEVFKCYVYNHEGCSECQKTNHTSGFIRVNIDPDLIRNPDLLVTKIGNIKPYFGSRTREKIPNLSSVQVESATPLLRGILHLIRVNSWFTDGPMWELIRRMFVSMTSLDVNKFKVPPDMISGSWDHRFQDQSTSHSAYLQQLYNIATYVQVTTTTLKEYSKGGPNVNLHYQAAMCSFIDACAVATNLNLWADCTTALHYHIDCPCCIKPTNDEKICGDESLDSVQFPNLSSYPALKEELTICERAVNQPSYCKQRLSQKDYHVLVALEISKRIWNKQSPTAATLSDLHLSTPLVWGMVCNPIYLVELVSCFLYGAWNFSKPYDRYCRVSDFIAWLDILRLPCFEPLSIIFQDPARRGALVKSHYFILGPESIPYRATNLYSCARDAIVSVVTSDRFPDLAILVSKSLTLLPLNIWNPVQLTKMVIGLYKLTLNTKSEIDQAHQSHIMFGHIMKSIDYDLVTLPEIFGRVTAATPSLTNLLQRQYKYVAMSADQASKLIKARIPKKDAISLCCDEKCQDSLILLANKITDNNEDSCPKEIPMLKQSYSFHFFKPSSIYTSAQYKWYPLLANVQGTGVKMNSTLCLADGSGGVTLLVLHMFPGKVMFNTLIDIKQAEKNNLADCYPPALDVYPHWQDRVIGLDRCVDGISDLTDPRWGKQLVNQCQTSGIEFDLITCDIEGSFWKLESNLEPFLLNLSIALDFSADTVVIILKVYGTHPHRLNGVFHWFSLRFKEVNLYRSVYSTPGTTEMFIMAHMKTHYEGPYVYESRATGVSSGIYNDISIGFKRDPFYPKTFDPFRGLNKIMSQFEYTSSLVRRLSATFGPYFDNFEAALKHCIIQPLDRVKLKYFELAPNLPVFLAMRVIPTQVLWDIILSHIWTVFHFMGNTLMDRLTAVQDILEEGSLVVYQSRARGVCALLMKITGHEGHNPRSKFFLRRLVDMDGHNAQKKSIPKKLALAPTPTWRKVEAKCMKWAFSVDEDDKSFVTMGPRTYGLRLVLNAKLAPSDLECKKLIENRMIYSI